MEMPAFFAETIELFSLVPDRRARLEQLVSIGEELERPVESLTNKSRVPGCVSEAHVLAHVEDGRIFYEGWADALIIRGFLVILIRGLSGREPHEIVDDAPAVVREFIDATDLNVSMVESRANSFANLFARMRALAEDAS